MQVQSADQAKIKMILACQNPALTPIQEPKWRVRALLTKLESDRKNGTDFFSHKFMAKVKEIFSGLPKPKDVRSFEGNDLPLLFTHSEVQQFALEHRLNKAQTKAVDALQKSAPEVFKDIVKSTPEQAIQKIIELASDPVRPVSDNKVSDIGGKGLQSTEKDWFGSLDYHWCKFSECCT